MEKIRLKVNQDIIDVFLLRSLKRKKGSISISIKMDGLIYLYVSSKDSITFIENSLNKHADWIREKHSAILARSQDIIFPIYQNNSKHFYLGKMYILVILSDSIFNHIEIKDDMLLMNIKNQKEESIKKLINQWYQEKALEIFNYRLTALVKLTPWVKKMPSLKIRKMKSRWGSCSLNGIITLNRALIKMRIELIDYVLLHELCHIKEHNHGREFYLLMESVCPDWKALKKELNKQSYFIFF